MEINSVMQAQTQDLVAETTKMVDLEDHLVVLVAETTKMVDLEDHLVVLVVEGEVIVVSVG